MVQQPLLYEMMMMVVMLTTTTPVLVCVTVPWSQSRLAVTQELLPGWTPWLKKTMLDE
jgi:ABC-type maltose transport system permease subunit